MKWSWKIGKFAGISVYVHATFLLLIAWLVLSGWSHGQGARSIAGGILFVLALFACVVLHEFGHALTAKHFGVGTRDITLLPIGGVSRLEHMPEDPRQELLVALAGPVVSLGIAASLFVFLKVAGIPSSMSQVTQLSAWSNIASFTQQLMFANVILAVFNLLPAFPMDGGRILRSFLARHMTNLKATRVAARVGQGMALLFGLFGLFANPFLLFIALFVWIGAAQEAAMAQMKSAMDGLPVGQLTITKFTPVSVSDSLGRIVELMLHGTEQDFPVIADGNLVGILTRKDLLRGLSESGPDTLVSKVMRRDFAVIAASEMVESAFEKLQASPMSVLPVFDQNRFLGLFTPESLAQYVMVRSALAESKNTGVHNPSFYTPEEPTKRRIA